MYIICSQVSNMRKKSSEYLLQFQNAALNLCLVIIQSIDELYEINAIFCKLTNFENCSKKSLCLVIRQSIDENMKVLLFFQEATHFDYCKKNNPYV